MYLQASVADGEGVCAKQLWRIAAAACPINSTCTQHQLMCRATLLRPNSRAHFTSVLESPCDGRLDCCCWDGTHDWPTKHAVMRSWLLDYSHGGGTALDAVNGHPGT